MKDDPSLRASKEPLAAMARFAYDFAPHFCSPLHGCQDYHRGWSLVRHFESEGAFPLGLSFFRRELGLLAESLGKARLRLMVSGAADTGVVAMLIAALAPLGIEPEFLIVDQCNTTLMQQRLFLTIADVSADFVQGDAVTADGLPVDAIISHSFIPFIPQHRRPALFANWARQLQPGGRILLSERLATDSPASPAWPDPSERQQRRTALAEKLQRAALSENDRSGFLLAADRLWDTTGTRQKMGLSDFHATIGAAGLKVRSLAEGDVTASVSPVASRAAVARRARHEIVLELQ